MPDPRAGRIRTYMSTNKRRRHRDVLAGLRSEATDLDWSFGDGELVSGPGEALVMAMLRSDVNTELTGSGAAVVASRTCGWGRVNPIARRRLHALLRSRRR
ncbi:MAG: hypothetical protein ACI8V4_000337 [Ilumatobacter sp.]|jgi:hypothetical protein